MKKETPDAQSSPQHTVGQDPDLSPVKAFQLFSLQHKLLQMSLLNEQLLQGVSSTVIFSNIKPTGKPKKGKKVITFLPACMKASGCQKTTDLATSCKEKAGHRHGRLDSPTQKHVQKHDYKKNHHAFTVPPQDS